MLKIYGTMLCKDCVACRADLDRAGVAYEFLEFAEAIQNMREFMALRDSSPVFDAVRGSGSIGIPCIVTPDGRITLSWSGFLPM